MVRSRTVVPKKNCLYCGKEYLAYLDGGKERKFCCLECYRQAEKEGRWLPSTRKRKYPKFLVCLWCGKKFRNKYSRARISKYCSPECYNHVRKAGKYNQHNIRRGKRHPCWQGGKYIMRGGYIKKMVKEHPHADEDGYVLEHRLVMEKCLGRYLKLKEVVHHIDGDPSNNNTSNLMLFPNDAAHHAYHHRLKENGGVSYVI